MGVLARKMMAAAAGIQYVGGNTASKDGATTGDSTIALNSGLTGGIASSVSTGDLVIAVFATASTADRTLAITDGANNYALITSELYRDAGLDTNLRVAYKLMGGTPDTSTTFGPTGSDSDAGTMAVFVFRGVNQTTPFDAATFATGNNTGAIQPNPPPLTPPTAGSFILCIGAGAHQDGVNTFTSSDLTGFLTIGHNDTNDSSLGGGHKDDWTSGAFDAAAFGTTNGGVTNNSWAAMSIALRPA
jgi:hypothetical protein